MSTRLRHTLLFGFLVPFLLADATPCAADRERSERERGERDAGDSDAREREDERRERRERRREREAQREPPFVESDRLWIMDVAADGMTDVRLSEIVLDRGRSEEVRRLARHLLDGHHELQDEMADLLATRGLSLHERIPPNHQAKVDRFEGLRDGELDRAYVEEMIAEHKRLVRKHEQASNRVKAEDLQGWAESKVAILRDYLDLAEDLAPRGPRTPERKPRERGSR